MKVTNIRMKLLDNGTPKYVAVASVTLDNAIVFGWQSARMEICI